MNIRGQSLGYSCYEAFFELNEMQFKQSATQYNLLNY